MVVRSRQITVSRAPSGGPGCIRNNVPGAPGTNSPGHGWPALANVTSREPGCARTMQAVTSRSVPSESTKALTLASTADGGCSSSRYARTTLRTCPIIAAAARSCPWTSPITNAVQPLRSGTTSYQSPPTSFPEPGRYRAANSIPDTSGRFGGSSACCSARLDSSCRSYSRALCTAWATSAATISRNSLRPRPLPGSALRSIAMAPTVSAPARNGTTSRHPDAADCCGRRSCPPERRTHQVADRLGHLVLPDGRAQPAADLQQQGRASVVLLLYLPAQRQAVQLPGHHQHMPDQPRPCGAVPKGCRVRQEALQRDSAQWHRPLLVPASTVTADPAVRSAGGRDRADPGGL